MRWTLNLLSTTPATSNNATPSHSRSNQQESRPKNEDATTAHHHRNGLTPNARHASSPPLTTTTSHITLQACQLFIATSNNPAHSLVNHPIGSRQHQSTSHSNWSTDSLLPWTQSKALQTLSIWLLNLKLCMFERPRVGSFWFEGEFCKYHSQCIGNF